MKFVIKTDKGFICEAKAFGYYEKSNNEFYRIETGKWFSSINSVCERVDKLGFTQEESEATQYSSCVGNRVNEIIERIRYGYEDISEILIKVKGEKQ